MVLELSFEKEGVWARLQAGKKLGPASMAFVHEAALKMLGLNNEVTPFETRHAGFAAPRRGLRLPNLPTAFDGLAWGIIGQQINVKFACSLRRDIILLAGEKIGDMRAHPTPERVADLSVANLHARRYSRSKAQYLIGAAEAIAKGELDIESLPRGSALAAEKKLTALHGVGTWTARYVLMRVGFADAAPVGDAALAAALQKLHKLPERPGTEQTEKLLAKFRAASQPRHHASVDIPERSRMKTLLGSDPVALRHHFAAWVDEAGRLLRFNLEPSGAARLDPGAERNSKALGDVRRQVNEYAKGKRQDFDLELRPKVRTSTSVCGGRCSTFLSASPPLRRHRQDHRPSRSRPGRGRRQWRQSHRPDRAVPPRHRQRRQPDRLWRRFAAQAQASGT